MNAMAAGVAGAAAGYMMGHHGGHAPGMPGYAAPHGYPQGYKVCAGPGGRSVWARALAGSTQCRAIF
jgi:hypothetical protein